MPAEEAVCRREGMRADGGPATRRSSQRGSTQSLYRLFLDQQTGCAGAQRSGSCSVPRLQNQHVYRRECRELLIPSYTTEAILGQSTDPGCLFCVRFNEDASLLAATNADMIQVWDPDSGRLLHSLREHKEIVTSVAWFVPSPSVPPAFFSCSLDKTIRLWMNFKPVEIYTKHQGKISLVRAFF